MKEWGEGMRCPRCNHNNSRVIDSRQTDDAENVKAVAFVLQPLNGSKQHRY